MKKIVIMLCLVFIVGCGNKIKVYIDPELDKKGVDIWNQNVKYVELTDGFNVPNVCLYSEPDLDLGVGVLGTTRTKNESGEYQTIIIIVNHSNVIAHEFGHFLSYEHNTDTNSIMYPIANLDRLLESYKEFQ